MSAYYFGCRRIGEAGHFLYDETNRPVRGRDLERDGLPAIFENALDGVYAPVGPQIEGRALRHLVHGRTIIAFWDRSVDSRPGSNSVFVLSGELTFDEAWAEAQRRFPWVVQRFTFSVVDASKP